VNDAFDAEYTDAGFQSNSRSSTLAGWINTEFALSGNANFEIGSIFNAGNCNNYPNITPLC
jgi:hypothetical protein